MIQKLTFDDVIALLQKSPEQANFDWKRDFLIPNNDEKRGEIIKDVTAIANSLTLSPGFIIYGVNPSISEPIIGITQSYDDASLQQLFKNKIEPDIEFIYYEVSFGPKNIGIIQILPSKKRPHIIKVDLGKVRNGQIPIRRGSSTDGVSIKDLFEMFYGQNSAYFERILNQTQLGLQQQNISMEYIRLLMQLVRENERKIQQSIWGL
jgi:predicted HTH transcriptional regulator